MGDKLKELKSFQRCLCYSYLNRLDHKSFMYPPCTGKGTLKIRTTGPLYDAKGKQELLN